jgi:uncharacterized Fe-S cluster-containing radical SAM superfamily protein
MIIMYDPIQLSKIMEEIVCKNSERKYFRFRAARFYGGIATGDVVGCNLRCYYCYVYQPREKPREIGKFYAPQTVAKILAGIARQRGFDKLRLSGGEPTIGKEHLIALLENIPEEFTFILETNGILLGYDENYVKEFKRFPNICVRVSLKGCTRGEFSKITGAIPQAFEYQLKALENCVKNDVSCYPAIMLDIIDKRNLKILKERLDEIDSRLFRELDKSEVLLKYPHVLERMKKIGVL